MSYYNSLNIRILKTAKIKHGILINLLLGLFPSKCNTVFAAFIQPFPSLLNGPMRRLECCKTFPMLSAKKKKQKKNKNKNKQKKKSPPCTSEG